MAKRPTPEMIEADILALETLDAKALRVRWQAVFKSDPPAKMQARFLRLAIAYRIQEKAFGAIAPTLVRQLKRHAEATGTAQTNADAGFRVAARFDPQTSLSPGTRLMREWNGATELVDVVSGGFTWRGKEFRTLSAVAVAITGTKWSGPKFFGLLRPNIANSNKAPARKPAPASMDGAAA